MINPKSADHHSSEAFCDVSQLSYLEVGTGPNVAVLLHGWSAFKEIWWSALDTLAPHYHAFALDLPGHGGSPLNGPGRMREVADRVAQFCAIRGFDRIALVGHSMGGNIALELTLSYPELVTRLVLVAPAAESDAMPAFTRSYLQRTGGWVALRASMVLHARLGTIGQAIPHRHGGGFWRPILRRAYYAARQDPESLHRLLDGMFANSLGERVTEIHAPTLVISGQFDPLVPPALSQRLANMIPGAQFTLLHRTAHNPMDEQPREFERILLQFLMR